MKTIWKIVLIAVIVLALGTAVFFYFRPKSSGINYFDQLKQQQEAAAQVTATPEPVIEEAPKVEWNVGEATFSSWKNEEGKFVVQAFVPVENTGNRNIHLYPVACTLLSAGNEVATDLTLSGAPAILKGGESGYYFCSAELDAEATDLSIVFNEDIKEAEETDVTFDIERVTLKSDEKKTYASGNAVNTTGDMFDGEITVIANFYDANNKPVFSGHSNITLSIGANRSAWFRVVARNVPADVLAQFDHVSAYAYKK